MSRIARVVVPGLPHHITQRGNGRQDVFRCDEDRQLYLELFLEYSERYRLDTWGFCLMTNHVHLLAVPERPNSLAKAIGRAHADYSRFFNVRYGRSGHLLEARYFSCPVEGPQIWAALRYIERNPVDAGIVGEPQDWRWSSARAHLSLAQPDGFLSMTAWRQSFDSESWRAELARGHDEDAARGLREASMRGRPLGSREFAERIGRRLGRTVVPRPVGRPRKKRDLPADVVQLEIGI